MKKKFMFLFLVFVFALSVFMTVQASSFDHELIGEEVILQRPGREPVDTLPENVIQLTEGDMMFIAEAVWASASGNGLAQTREGILIDDSVLDLIFADENLTNAFNEAYRELTREARTEALLNIASTFTDCDLIELFSSRPCLAYEFVELGLLEDFLEYHGFVVLYSRYQSVVSAQSPGIRIHLPVDTTLHAGGSMTPVGWLLPGDWVYSKINHKSKNPNCCVYRVKFVLTELLTYVTL